MEDRLLLCFNTLNVDSQKVASLVANYDVDDDATEELNELYKQLTKEIPVPSAVLTIIRDHIDSAFVDFLGDGTTASHVFGQSSEADWTIGIVEYCDQLITSVAQTVSELETSGEIDTMDLSDEAQIAVRHCASKMYIVLTAGLSIPKAMGNLPFMCRSAYSFMSQRLSLIPDALKEVRVLYLNRYQFMYRANRLHHEVHSEFGYNVYARIDFQSICTA